MHARHFRKMGKRWPSGACQRDKLGTLVESSMSVQHTLAVPMAAPLQSMLGKYQTLPLPCRVLECESGRSLVFAEVGVRAGVQPTWRLPRDAKAASYRVNLKLNSRSGGCRRVKFPSSSSSFQPPLLRHIDAPGSGQANRSAPPNTRPTT